MQSQLLSSFANQITQAQNAAYGTNTRFLDQNFDRQRNQLDAQLASKGIPDGVMTTEAFGETRPRVETADGVREVQNRRVEITYGPGSGQ